MKLRADMFASTEHGQAIRRINPQGNYSITKREQNMSEFMPWKPEYSVGDDSIDAQHKRIINLINELYLILKTRGEGNRAKVIEALDQLVHYTIDHFQREEQVMRECGYPALADHQALHVKLKRRTAAMRSNFDLVTERDMLCYLKDWWSQHILEQDMAYAPYLGVASR